MSTTIGGIYYDNHMTDMIVELTVGRQLVFGLS